MLSYSFLCDARQSCCQPFDAFPQQRKNSAPFCFLLTWRYCFHLLSTSTGFSWYFWCILYLPAWGTEGGTQWSHGCKCCWRQGGGTLSCIEWRGLESNWFLVRGRIFLVGFSRLTWIDSLNVRLWFFIKTFFSCSSFCSLPGAHPLRGCRRSAALTGPSPNGRKEIEIREWQLHLPYVKQKLPNARVNLVNLVHMYWVTYYIYVEYSIYMFMHRAWQALGVHVSSLSEPMNAIIFGSSWSWTKIAFIAFLSRSAKAWPF